MMKSIWSGSQFESVMGDQRHAELARFAHRDLL